MKQISGRQRAFTVIEMMVVIVVIGILAGSVYFAIQSWRTDADQNQLKNDLGSMKSSLEQYQNFNNAYPPNLTNVYTPTAKTTLTYTLRADGSYCANATHERSTELKFALDSKVGEVVEGTCTP